MADGSVTIKVDLDGEKAQSGVGKLKTLLGGLESTGSKIGSVFKSVLGANLIGSALTKGVSVLTSNLGGAIQRFDTLNKYPTVMKSLGYSVDDVAKSTKILSDGIDGLPTTLDGITAISQQLAPLTGSATKASESAIALNNAFLASGAGADGASRGLQQYTQMLSTGKVDMMSWRTLQETMPIALRKTAEAFGYTGKAATNDLYEALKSGSITMDELNDKFIELNKGQNGFAELAKQNSAGIGTSFSNLRNSVAKNLANMLTDIDKAFSKKGLGSIASQIDNLKHLVNGAFQSISPHVTNFAMAAIDVFGRITDKVKTFWDAFSNTGAVSAFAGALKSIAGAIGHVWNSLTASGVLNVLASVLGNVVKWLSQAATVAANFISSLPAGAIQAIVGGLVGLVAGFKAFNFLKSFNPFSLFKKNATSGVSGATSVVRSASTSVVSIIRSLGQSVATAARGIGQGVGAAFRGIGQGLAMVNPATIAALAVPILALGAAFALMGMQGQGIAAILQGVGSVIVSVGTAIGTILNMALQGLANALVIVAPVLPTIASAFAMLSPLITAAGTAIATVISAFSSLSPVITALGSALSQVIGAVSSGIAQIATAVTPIIGIISNAFVQVVTVVSQAIVQIIQALAPFIPSITQMVQAVAPVLQSLVQAFTTLVTQISPIIDSITQLFETLGEQISSILESASGVIESFGSSIRTVLDGVAGIFESMGNAAKNAGQGVKLMAQGVKMLVDLKLGDLVGTLAAVATGLAAIAGSGIASAGPELQQAGTGLRLIATSAQLASVAMQTLPTAFTALNTSLGTLPAVMTTAGTAMTVFATSTIASLAGLVGSVASVTALQVSFTSLSASMLMAQAGASAMSAGFSAVSAVIGALGGILGTVPARFTAITTSAMMARTSIMQLATSAPMVASGFASISSAATSAMTQLNSAVRSAMTQAVSTMRSSMQQMVSVVRQSASQMTQAGQQAGRGVSNGVTNGIRGGIGSATAAMSAMVNAIRSTGMSGAGAMRGVGTMIGQGLAQGMYSALGAVTAAANALVAQAERAAQAKAKIHSPSRLFRDNVGRYIAQGIAVGIEKNTSDVTDSLAYVQKEMSAFKFGAEELLGLGNSSLSSQFRLKSITERAEMNQIEVIRDQADQALTRALEVAEQAVKRPVNMIMDTGALVGQIGEPMTNYQNDKIKIDNMMRGIV